MLYFRIGMTNVFVYHARFSKFKHLRVLYSISAITCQPLSPIEGAILACTNGTLFRSVCSFNCDVGYDMPPEVSKALVCQSDKTWRKHGEPKCIGKVQYMLLILDFRKNILRMWLDKYISRKIPA